METVSNAPKRKKRKTRKCLDEIWKRSRGNTNNTFTTPRIDKVNRINHADIRPNNICITTSRLTLAMFPKVIRSETITRPIHPEIKDQDIFLRSQSDSGESVTSRSLKIQLSNNETDSNASPKNDEVENYDNASINHGMLQKFSPQRHSDISRNRSSQNSPGSLILFSTIDRTEDSDILEISPSAQSSSSLLSRSSREGYGYRLYEEFMNEIPVYLRQHSPALIKEDVMKKAKTFLHNIYLEGCRKECETNILNCISDLSNENKFVPRVTAVHSPMESPPLSIAPSRRPQPLAQLHALQDTPDYAYYPRKLNN